MFFKIKIIQDLWILTDGGIVLFNRVFDPKVCVQLFGALMTALDSYSKEVMVGNEGLKSFQISNIRFTIVKKKNLLFVANSNKNVKNKKVLEVLDTISDKFFHKYSELFEKFEDWNMNINLFLDFEKEIENQLEDPVKKFWNGMIK